MGDELKWFFIAMAVILGGGVAAAAYSDHAESQCKIAAFQAKVPADQIEDICK